MRNNLKFHQLRRDSDWSGCSLPDKTRQYTTQHNTRPRQTPTTPHSLEINLIILSFIQLELVLTISCGPITSTYLQHILPWIQNKKINIPHNVISLWYERYLIHSNYIFLWWLFILFQFFCNFLSYTPICFKCFSSVEEFNWKW